MLDYLIYMELFAENADFERLTRIWQQKQGNIAWQCPFVLPPWLETWWQVFGNNYQPYLKIVYSRQEPVGIVPLKFSGNTVTFMGSENICDYQDFTIKDGYSGSFFSLLLDELRDDGFGRLKLRHVRPESEVIKGLVPVARARGLEIKIEQEACSLEIDLPASFEDYLAALEKKQRHELRRKLRRLIGAGEPFFCFTNFETGNTCRLEQFLTLFRLNDAKTGFMTPVMEQFFRLMSERLTAERLLRFGNLTMDNREVAMVLVFDYNNTIYLYNSAYDPVFSSISPGLMSKALAVKEAIRMNRQRWDFLKGEEPYKRHLGGEKVSLYGVEIEIG
ncbi:MAG: GNAT family N-acetyltransferase [Dehalococcoidaceae bacterium]|nr:GNAT family N-acetyltransferase [Dehalococcoidaceae bacterium]